MGKISQLPDDLLDVISSMLPGRESIEFWMVRNRINDRSDKRVTTELRKRHNKRLHDITANVTHHLHLTTSTEMDIILPLWVESVTFICPWVTSIGNGWMTGHPSLTHVDFADMSSIETIGHDWMCRCASLVSIDFSGLSNLTMVGRNWLGHCEFFFSPDFDGLSQLARVGDE